jgi:hypothetical protein
MQMLGERRVTMKGCINAGKVKYESCGANYRRDTDLERTTRREAVPWTVLNPVNLSVCPVWSVFRKVVTEVDSDTVGFGGIAITHGTGQRRVVPPNTLVQHRLSRPIRRKSCNLRGENNDLEAESPTSGKSGRNSSTERPLRTTFVPVLERTAGIQLRSERLKGSRCGLDLPPVAGELGGIAGASNHFSFGTSFGSAGSPL